jgi:hypothetical protein
MSVVTPGRKVMTVAGIFNINFYTYVQIIMDTQICQEYVVACDDVSGG